MKKLLVIMGTVLLSAGHAFAAQSVQVPTAASVEGQVSLETIMFKGQEWIGPQVNAFNFGPLVPVGQLSPELRGTDHFTIAMYVNTSQRPFQIKQTGTALSNGTHTLPAGACIVTPTYANALSDPGSLIGNMGARTSFVGSDKVLYTDNQGRSAQVYAVYAITSDSQNGATQQVPSDQPPGNYTGSVTVSLALL